VTSRSSKARNCLWAISFVCLLLLSWVPAGAHAILLRAVPSPNSTVSGPDVALELKFNSRVDGKRSRVILVGPGTEQHPVDLTQQAPDVLASKVPVSKPGPYHVRWQVLAADGHITRGEFVFKVN